MRKNVKLSLLFNSLIVVLELVTFIFDGEMYYLSDVSYCQLANLLALVASLLMIIYTLIKKEINEIPFWVVVSKYVASVSLALVTIGLFVFVLPAHQGFENYFEAVGKCFNGISNIALHTLVPVLSVVSFIFFEGDRRLNKKKTMYYPCIFTIVYIIVVSVLTLTETIYVPYIFFDFDNNPWFISVCWAIVFMVINYVIARYVLLFNQIRAPRIKIKR